MASYLGELVALLIKKYLLNGQSWSPLKRA
ncbi:hypothetical protein Goarm_005721 [Gossypium armourianum]|uniref:Uncharacterized protein n=1 Tax=Gossypium armourianum TaxID=34283 RepID=A0A7J9KI49_9ROSI|nr:hypothetical protein [Gossypium armourianum]